jgi:hypothetical protein
MRVAGDEVAMATATRAMVTATMVTGGEEGDGDGDKGG